MQTSPLACELCSAVIASQHSPVPGSGSQDVSHAVSWTILLCRLPMLLWHAAAAGSCCGGRSLPAGWAVFCLTWLQRCGGACGQLAALL